MFIPSLTTMSPKMRMRRYWNLCQQLLIQEQPPPRSQLEQAKVQHFAGAESQRTLQNA